MSPPLCPNGDPPAVRLWVSCSRMWRPIRSQLFVSGTYRNVSEKPTKDKLSKIQKKLLASVRAP